MYIGHIGVALFAKGKRPQLPLAALVLTAFGCDWVEECFIAAGARNTAGWSHSVPATLAGALAVGAAALLLRRRWVDAGVLAGVYVAHILADYVTGRKPVLFNGPYTGLGLYHYPILDFVLETVVLAIGWSVYRRSIPAGQRTSQIAVGLLVALVLGQGTFDCMFAS